MKTPGDPRNNYIVSLDWTTDSRELFLQHMNRLQNTLQLITADPKTGASKTILTETDEAWIDHMQPEIKWLEGGKRFLWMSERDGWKHAYTVARDGSNRKPIAPGDYDAIAIQGVDEPGGWLYFMASPDDATKRFLYRARLDGSGKAERVSPDDSGGWNNVNVSPNGRWAVQSSSSLGTYPKTAMLDLAKKTTLRTMVDNSVAQEKLNKERRGPHEFFKIGIGGGVTLDGWMMKPPDFDPSKKYPVLFYAYSGPSGQTVMDMWTGANYFWYLMLTQQGYIVASVDNRGTPAPKGRAWRKVIYKKMGILNPAEQAAAVKAMAAKMPFIDLPRIGITGASSGGTATLDALFRYPDIYKVGMALSPGADNSHYDTIYTERYMGLPGENAELYKESASTTHAGNLKGDLLIIHGTGDDNVHYQSTEILMDALIAAGKQFTIMPYPNRTHNLSEGEGTTPHLYNLMTRYLNDHLPAGGR
jgi:dipeptidyl-peptidase-4